MNRRREDRVTGDGIRARMRPGHRLVIIDLSPHGALVEARRPMRPGSHVDLQLETGARRGTVAARVVRCAVAAIDSESGVTYRAALCFSDTCDWVRETLTPDGNVVPGLIGVMSSVAPAGGTQLPDKGNDESRVGVKDIK